MTRQKISNISLGILIAFILLFQSSCSNKSNEKQKQQPATVSPHNFIVMEKIMSDQPGRARTTMKVIIPGGKATDEAAMKAALDQARQQDKELKSVIIWAYRTRKELNASTYTAGKLEWSADNKDYNGTAQLSPNSKIELLNH